MKQAIASSNSGDIRKTSVMPIGQVVDEYQRWPDGIPKNQINILPIGAAIEELSAPKPESENLRMPIELLPDVAKVAACAPARAPTSAVVGAPSVPAAQSRPCTVTGRGGRESKRHRALSHSALTLPPPHAGHIYALGVLIFMRCVHDSVQ